MKKSLKIEQKIAKIEQIVNADYTNGRTIKRNIIKKITEAGKCPFLFCKELTRLKEIS